MEKVLMKDHWAGLNRDNLLQHGDSGFAGVGHLESASIKCGEKWKNLMLGSIPMPANQNNSPSLQQPAAPSPAYWQQPSFPHFNLLSSLTEILNHQCLVCGESYPSPTDLYQHMIKHHKSIPDTPNQNLSNEKFLQGINVLSPDNYIDSANIHTQMKDTSCSLSTTTSSKQENSGAPSPVDSMKINLQLRSWLCALSTQPQVISPYLYPGLLYPGIPMLASSSNLNINQLQFSTSISDATNASHNGNDVVKSRPQFPLLVNKDFSKVVSTESLNKTNLCHNNASPIDNQSKHSRVACNQQTSLSTSSHYDASDQQTKFSNSKFFEKLQEVSSKNLAKPAVDDVPPGSRLNVKSIEQHISKLISNNEKLLTNPDLEKVKPRRVFRRSSFDPSSMRCNGANFSRLSSNELEYSKPILNQNFKSFQFTSFQDQITNVSGSSPETNKVIQLTRVPSPKNTQHILSGKETGQLVGDQNRLQQNNQIDSFYDLQPLKKNRRTSFFECRSCGVRYRKEDNYKIHKEIYCKYKSNQVKCEEKPLSREAINSSSVLENGIKRKISTSSDENQGQTSLTNGDFVKPKYMKQDQNLQHDLCRTKSADGLLETRLKRDEKNLIKDPSNKNFPAKSALLFSESETLFQTLKEIPEKKLLVAPRKNEREHGRKSEQNKGEKFNNFHANSQNTTKFVDSVSEMLCDHKTNTELTLTPRSNYKFLVQQLSLRNMEDIHTMLCPSSKSVPNDSVWSWQQLTREVGNKINRIATLPQLSEQRPCPSSLTMKITTNSESTTDDQDSKTTVGAQLPDHEIKTSSNSVLTQSKPSSYKQVVDEAVLPKTDHCRKSEHLSIDHDSCGSPEEQSTSQRSLKEDAMKNNSNLVILHPHEEAVLRSETLSSFCCIVSPQPSYMEAEESGQVSMYSDWSVSEPFLIPPGLSVDNLLSGWRSNSIINRNRCFTTASSSVSPNLISSKEYNDIEQKSIDSPSGENSEKSDDTSSPVIKEKTNQECDFPPQINCLPLYASCGHFVSKTAINVNFSHTPSWKKALDEPSSQSGDVTKEQINEGALRRKETKGEVETDREGSVEPNSPSTESNDLKQQRINNDFRCLNPGGEPGCEINCTTDQVIVHQLDNNSVNSYLSKPNHSSPNNDAKTPTIASTSSSNKQTSNYFSSDSFVETVSSGCASSTKGLTNGNGHLLMNKCVSKTSAKLSASESHSFPPETPALPSNEFSLEEARRYQNKTPTSSSNEIASRRYRCADCEIAFRIPGHLAKHMRSKAHSIQLQKKVFNQMRSVKMDPASADGIRNQSDILQLTETENSVVFGDTKSPIQIEDATDSSKQDTNMNRECASSPPQSYSSDHPIHSNLRPYKCFVCKVAFRFKGHLDRHLRSHAHFIVASQKIQNLSFRKEEPTSDSIKKAPYDEIKKANSI